MGCKYSECFSLTNLVIPNSVTSIGQYALHSTGWYDNKPNGLVYAGKVAYDYKYEEIRPDITNIILEDGTVGIAEQAFINCSELKIIDIPNSILCIGSNAFPNSLNEVTVRMTTPISISSDAIPSRANSTLYVPVGCKNVYEGAAYWNEFKKIEEGTFKIESIPDVTYNGSAQTPAVTVKDGNTTLTNGTDYTVSYSNNTNAGTASVIITGKGDYTGVTRTAHFTIYRRSASNLTIGSIAAVTYNGSAQTPAVTVRDGTITLTEGTDYTVAYSNNINVGTATVTVTGKGNYTGTKTANFIIHASLDDLSSVRIGSGTNSTNTAPFHSTNKFNEVFLKYDSDEICGTGKIFAISFDENWGNGYAYNTSVEIWMGSISNMNFYLTPNPSGNEMLSQMTRVYQGQITIEPNNSGAKRARTIYLDTPFEYDGSYDLNIFIATSFQSVPSSALKYDYTETSNPSVKYRGFDNSVTPSTWYWSNSYNRPNMQLWFDNLVKDINSSDVSISPIAAVTYNGLAQTPTVTVKDGSTTLTSGTDYTVAYSNNTNAGTATVTITGKGNYTGTKTVNFTINGKSASNLTVSSIAAQTYTGTALTPAVTVKDGSTILTSGTDYTVSYSNNTNAGTATITVTGKGNYTGTKSANFTINPKNASNLTVNSVSAVTYNGTAQIPTVTVKNGSTTLTNGTHYTVSYSNNTNAGTATVTITGKGNYTGTKTADFTINKASLTVTAKSYTITQGNPLPTFECTYSGFKNGETASALTTLPTINCSATSSSAPGTYDIIVSGGSATNYAFNYVKGTLTIEAYVNNIQFADNTVKSICVANWDTSGDGELSETEAAAVTDLGRTFKDNTTITSFNELRYFTGLTSIGEHAFEDCSGLTSIIIPNSVNSIGTSAFGYCSGLKSVTIPSSVTSIGKSAFEWCSHLTSVIIPSSVTSIGASAFEGCRGLTSVTIPSSVTSIGVSAFRTCSGLTSIVVEEGNRNYDSRNKCNAIIEKASNKLIAGCNTTTIPSSVTSIGAYAFGYLSGLTSVTIPNSVTSIGESAFYQCSGLTSITIPNSVTSIGIQAFSGCSGLTSVTIPNSVTSIESHAFSGCSGLTSVAFGNSVTSIGERAFFGCSGLTSVTIPNSVTSIGECAFYECSGLTNVIIPNSVISIGGAAFWFCRLTSMVVDNVSPPTAEDLLFDSQFSYPTLYVPKDSKAAFQVADNWSAMHFKAIKEFPDPDVNQDGTVNVVDVVDIARFVVGTPRNEFVEFLADLNNSGGVNVADAVVLVNEIAGDTQFARQLRAPEQTGSDVLTLCSVDDTRLSFKLDGSGRYAAFQFDLWLPSDVDVMQLSLNNERSQGHQLLYNKMGDSHYRVVALSASGSAFNGASGELLGLTFDGLATDEVGIDNIHFVTTNGTDVPFDALGVTVSSEVTAIRSAENSSEGAQPAYNLNGQRLESPRKGLNIIGGKKIVVK